MGKTDFSYDIQVGIKPSGQLLFQPWTKNEENTLWEALWVKNWVLYFHANKQAPSLTYSNWMGSTAVVPYHCHQINWNGRHCDCSSWSRAADAGRAAVMTFKKKQNRSHHPLVFARVLTKWKHVLGKAAWGSHIDARRALSRLWWIKKLNECGRENEIDHLIFSFADPQSMLLCQQQQHKGRYNSNKVMCNLQHF